MIRLYTSYYANVTKRRYSNVLYIPVSNTMPDWFDLDIVRLDEKVCPSWGIINAYKGNKISYKEFSRLYLQQLEGNVGLKNRLVSELNDLVEATGCEEIIFLCWEKDKCHRTVLAEWLTDKLTYIGELE